VGLKSPFGRCGEEKEFLLLSGIELRFPGSPARSLVNILTAILADILYEAVTPRLDMKYYGRRTMQQHTGLSARHFQC
jgi:hypothetical protein